MVGVWNFGGKKKKSEKVDLDDGTYTPVVVVRGTPTAGVLIHWVIISRRWERIQQRDSESPVNTDSPRKEKCFDSFPGRKITGPKNTQN